MSQSIPYNKGRLWNVNIFKLKPLRANMLSALQLHSFPHLADPLGEVTTSINITLKKSIKSAYLDLFKTSFTLDCVQVGSGKGDSIKMAFGEIKKLYY